MLQKRLYVFPRGNSWAITDEEDAEPLFLFKTQHDAIQKALVLALKSGAIVNVRKPEPEK